jgi:hypothetical protein
MPTSGSSIFAQTKKTVKKLRARSTLRFNVF